MFSIKRVRPLVALLAVLAAGESGRAAPKPVPASPYLGIVYRYADTLLQHARDSHGPQQTGLILSALDRTRLAPLTDRPAAPTGVGEPQRDGEAGGPLVGANPLHDENLLRLLYTLSELSSKPIYRDAADAELKWFLQDFLPARDPLTAWDETISWNVITDTMIRNPASGSRGPHRPWLLWDRSFELAPDESKRLAAALITAPGATGGSLRRDGLAIRGLAALYHQTKDDTLLQAMEAIVKRHDNSQSLSIGKDNPSPPDWLSAAIEFDGAARRVPVTLSSRLKALALRADQSFLSLPHDLKTQSGFARMSSQPSEQPTTAATTLWTAGADAHTTASVAMLCVARYENTGDVHFRQLIHTAADAYATSLPAGDADIWPMVFGHAISLQLAAWRSTARQEYMDRAMQLADVSIQTFWSDGPLPRASSKSSHYETITGSDSLALALVELHLSILGITAVRSPANTIDR